MTTPAHELADSAVAELAAVDPCLAIVLGQPVEPGSLTDFSPEGWDSRHDLMRTLAGRAAEVPVAGDGDRVTREVLAAQLAVWLEAADAGDHLRELNILGSPPQQLRNCLELLPDDTSAADLDAFATALPDALAGWRRSLALGAETGLTAARRQALAVAGQLHAYAEQWLPGWFAGRGADPGPGAEAAAAALHDTAVWLADVYPGDDVDAVGEARYRRAARAYNGIDLDLDDTFAWGWEELERLTGELHREIARVDPSLTPATIGAHLDADPRYQLHGVEALTTWLNELVATATDAVDGRYFDIDPRVRACQVRIAPAGAAAAPYYLPPSEDLTRPGSTWYPTMGAEEFTTWWLTSVWYHEAVPGHHLQLGATAAMDDLSRFQRTLAINSGHAEGWALYAERLADELGWFDQPGTRIGYLSAQLMRAVRVVVDIGLHTGRRIPAGTLVGRGHITPELAQQLLVDLALLEPGFSASEVDRYLGLPGQAISYKVGERVWWNARAEAKQRLGDRFDLLDWHMSALRLGPMGLAQLQQELAGYGR